MTQFQPYTLKLGDNGNRVARRFRLTRRELSRINGITSRKQWKPGLTILVPNRHRRKRSASITDGDTRPTDLCTGIAPVDPPVIAAVPKRYLSIPRGKQRIYYHVAEGDTLGEIARHLGLSVSALAFWNGLDPAARLQDEMVLQIFVPSDAANLDMSCIPESDVHLVAAGSREFLELKEQQRGRLRINYRVRKGDTLRRIARRFKLSVGSIMRINKFSRRTRLSPGDEVVLYVELSLARRRWGLLSKVDRKRLQKALRQAQLQSSSPNDRRAQKGSRS